MPVRLFDEGVISHFHRAGGSDKSSFGKTETVNFKPGRNHLYRVGGIGFIKGVLGPMPWTNIMPTGGVEPTEESLRSWFNAGAYCVGMGSNLITGEIIKNRDFEQLTSKTREIVEIVKKIRK